MAGKNIGLIVSSASRGISGVESDAKRLVTGGNFLTPNLWIRSSQTSNCRTLVSTWLTNIDYANLSTGITAWNDDSSIQIISTSDAIQIIGYFNSWSLYDIMGNRVSETTNAILKTNTFSVLPFYPLLLHRLSLFEAYSLNPLSYTYHLLVE